MGPFYDRGHLRLILATGTFLMVFGHMMLSLCTSYWQVLLAQGLVVGVGGGCLFVPSLAVMQPYFSAHLGLAVGVAATGSSVGGVVFPVVFTNLIERVGFPWTTRVIGFLCLATLVVPLTLSRMRSRPPAARSFFDRTALTDGPYLLCVFACFLGYVGCYAAFYYMSLYGEKEGWVSTDLALYLVPILNAGSVVGRAVPNWVSDKVGPTNVVMPGMYYTLYPISRTRPWPCHWSLVFTVCPGAFMTGVVLLCNLAVRNAAGVIVTALFLGFFTGVFIATPPVLLVRLTADKSKVGTRMGMAFAVIGLGVLAGGPGSGAVLQHGGDGLDWAALWTYAGVFTLASGVAFASLRIWLCGMNFAAKV